MILFTGQIFAQNAVTASTDGKAEKQTIATTQTCGKYVDNNKDGICDNRETIRHYLELKKVCDPEQALLLSNLYRELYGCPMHRPGGGMKHRRH